MPRAIGVDEIAIWKGLDYRIVVSDLDRRRPIWVGGKGQARAIFDKFHIVRRLGEALDAVRRSEDRYLAAKDRAFIKEQRYTLLSHRETLSLDIRRSLTKRLNTTHLRKESLGQL